MSTPHAADGAHPAPDATQQDAAPEAVTPHAQPAAADALPDASLDAVAGGGLLDWLLGREDESGFGGFGGGGGCSGGGGGASW